MNQAAGVEAFMRLQQRSSYMSRDGEVRIFLSEQQDRRIPLIILNVSENDEEEEKVWALTQGITDTPFNMLSISFSDARWDRDLSPWPAPAVFKSGNPFEGKADDYLKLLEEQILPHVQSQLEKQPSWIGLAGYSLAGLFAVYAMYRSKVFSRIASASGSFWYHDFEQYAKSQPFARKPEKIYFSLGDKEAKTRNVVMKSVEEKTRDLAAWYAQQDIDTIFELNPGNHFVDAAERTAKGLAWILEG